MLKLKDIANKIGGGMFYLNIKSKDNFMYDSKEVWKSNFGEMIELYGNLNVISIVPNVDGFVSIFLEEE